MCFTSYPILLFLFCLAIDGHRIRHLVSVAAKEEGQSDDQTMDGERPQVQSSSAPKTLKPKQNQSAESQADDDYILRSLFKKSGTSMVF